MPTARELALDAKARELIEFAETPLLTMARPVRGAARRAARSRRRRCRTAFDAAHRDPQFLAEADKLGVDISPVTADAISHALDDMAHASPAALDYMKKLMAGAKG